VASSGWLTITLLARTTQLKRAERGFPLLREGRVFHGGEDFGGPALFFGESEHGGEFPEVLYFQAAPAEFGADRLVAIEHQVRGRGSAKSSRRSRSRRVRHRGRPDPPSDSTSPERDATSLSVL